MPNQRLDWNLCDIFVGQTGCRPRCRALPTLDDSQDMCSCSTTQVAIPMQIQNLFINSSTPYQLLFGKGLLCLLQRFAHPNSFNRFGHEVFQ